MQMPFCPKLWDRSPAQAQPENGVAINGTVVVGNSFGLSAPGKSTTLRLFSSTQIDPGTRKGKLSPEAALRSGKKTKHGKASTRTYQVTFVVDAEFGTPGAVVVKNGNRGDQFFLRHVQLELAEDRSLHFECNSWVYPYRKTNADRLFFINTCYLPAKTPEALRLLRDEELRSLRGNGRGERKDWERIYDYDYYNDLGNPDAPDHARPVVGGTKTYPYPRRCRTGRPLSKTDGVTETRKHLLNLDFYIPPDERFSHEKLTEFLTLAVQAVTHFVIPELHTLIEGNDFRSLEQLRKDLYSKPKQPAADGEVMQQLKSSVPSQKTYKQVAKNVRETPVKFPVPQVIQHDSDAWKSDEEFAREMLAGLNPVAIQRLQEFPPVSSGGKQSSIKDVHIAGQLEGLTIDVALRQNRVYILDHHDYLMPYLRRINTLGVCIYASRTLLFLRDDGTLKPVAIELSLPGDDSELSRVFVPASQQGSTDALLWGLAKAHVSVTDSGYHQLISHWLRTHCAVEPFIIATKRQLSAMHPVHKLLDPHFKDTMQINTLARSILLNAGGILERTMYPGRYAVEMSSAVYAGWRFADQSLPRDLLARGMAAEDPAARGGVALLVEDYPYAADGLDVWCAIDAWVRGYCAHFYHADAEVAADAELQAWWNDVRFVGHGDRQGDPACWPPLDTVAGLAEALATLVWIASAMHAAVNFGQYGYAGYPPNRPTRCRRFVPLPGSPEMAQLEADPERFFLEMVPDRFTTTLGIALIEVLSNHTSDELYLGQRATATWTDDGEVLKLLDMFREDLRRVEKKVEERNRDPRLKNRRGPVQVPYTLLYPDVGNVAGKEKGITGKGIPNSVSA